MAPSRIHTGGSLRILRDDPVRIDTVSNQACTGSCVHARYPSTSHTPAHTEPRSTRLQGFATMRLKTQISRKIHLYIVVVSVLRVLPLVSAAMTADLRACDGIYRSLSFDSLSLLFCLPLYLMFHTSS